MKLREQKGRVMAARLAGPFVMTFQGEPSNQERGIMSPPKTGMVARFLGKRLLLIGCLFLGTSLLLIVSLFLGISLLLVGSRLPSQKSALTTLTDAEAVQLSKTILDLAGKGKYAEAIPLAQALATDAERGFGASHTNVTSFLDYLAALHYRTANFAKAEPLYQRSLKIREEQLGAEHPDTALSLNNLALLYQAMGDYSKAEPLYQRSLKIREKQLGPEHPDTAMSLNNLACLYQVTCDYSKAEPLYQRSLMIMEKELGPEHSNTATSLNNLAMLYQAMGDYSKAELLHQRSLMIMEKQFGPEHPNTATSLNNLAELYRGTGDYGKAEPLCQRSLKIREKQLGSEHPDTAMSLNNLALLYQVMGDYSKAEPLYQRSLKIREKQLGSEHPDTAASLNNLAMLYQAMCDYSKAESLYQRSLKIMEKQLGPEHSNTATSLNNLAFLYQVMANYSKAEPLYQRSLKIMEKQLGPDHPSTVQPLGGLAALYAANGDVVQAHSLAQRARAAEEKALGEVLSFGSESQRLAYQRQQDPYFLFATLGSAPELAEAILRNKGVVLDSLLEDEVVARSSKDPAVKRMLEQLQIAGQRLMKLEIEVPKDLGQQSRDRRMIEKQALADQVENLQKALARNVASLGQVRRALRITVPEVQSALVKDAVLLEFVRYGHYLGKAEFEARYGVVVLGNPKLRLPGAKAGEAVWVPLGSAAAIERNLKAYQQAMRFGGTNGLMVLKTLHTQLFEPIRQRLPGEIKTLVVSPDAELNFISLGTLISESGRFLAEDYALQYVASGRDLVFGLKGRKPGRRLAAFANPAFGNRPALARAGDTNAIQLAMASTDRRDYAGVSLLPLPNTAKEGDFLRDQSPAWKLEGVVYAGAEATEAEVKAVKSPYILHLATHGFFLPDTLPTNQPALRLQLPGQERQPVTLHNPMHRSGLAFAGAQLTLDGWKRGETPDPENDGILMAQEVGTIDLKETWLVVLSACDTGVGEARGGEGVLGLRRGFIQAGAQNLLMTLWPVSDRWTMELMKAFYDRALKTGDAPMALAEVQREFLVKLREQKGPVMAARLAGPFVMTFQGGQPQ